MNEHIILLKKQTLATSSSATAAVAIWEALLLTKTKRHFLNHSSKYLFARFALQVEPFLIHSADPEQLWQLRTDSDARRSGSTSGNRRLSCRNEGSVQARNGSNARLRDN